MPWVWRQGSWPCWSRGRSLSSPQGKPWTWSFDPGGLIDIDALRLSFAGSKTAAIGLALDNVSPALAVPEASGGGQLGLVLALDGVRLCVLSLDVRAERDLEMLAR
jgi:hypothetical protein